MSRARFFQSPDLVLQAIQRGRLCAILVEGEEQASDAALLKFILRDVTTEVAFFGRDGRSGVLIDLQEMIGQLPVDRLYAILDRDFESDEAVEQSFHPDYRGHIFFWGRFTIENYLLEPAWVIKAIKAFYVNEPLGIPAALQTEEAVEQFLLEWANRLLPQVAGNATKAKLLIEINRRELEAWGPPDFKEPWDRDAEFVRSRLMTHYSAWEKDAPDLFTPEAISKRYDAQLTAAQSAIGNLNEVHKWVSGKLLLEALYQQLPSQRHKAHLRNQLAVFASEAVPADMRTLVIDRILPRWRRAREGQA